MSEEEAPKTVTLTKEQFDQLMGTISELKDKVQDLSNKAEQTNQSQAQGAPRRPMFHSTQTIQSAQMGRAQREAEKYNQIQQDLDTAVDMVIKHYKEKPPAFK